LPEQLNTVRWEVNGNETPGRASIDKRVSECPICHFTIEPRSAGIPEHSNGDWLESYFRCSNPQCRHLFIEVYEIDRGMISQPGTLSFRFVQCLPWKAVERQFAKAIRDTSPDFVGIHNQASAAEAYGLSDVAGPGFRKALEFLLKDYAIRLHSDDADWIRRAQLAQVISKHFTDPRLQVAFSRATWLGNDQTHYERRWSDFNINDLKRLIDLSISFIEMEILSAELATEMPHPNQI
jgi:hypothetical protein